MIKLLNEDCIKTIKRLKDNKIDCVITSPPYNVDLGNNKYNKTPYSLYKDNKEHSEYIEWLRSIFCELQPKIVEGGRVCINIGDGKNGSVPTSSDIIHFMNDLSYILVAHIIWMKNQVGNRTAWGSYMSPSCPSYPCPFEHILIFAKGNKKLQHKGETDLTKEEFSKFAFGLWTFKPETKAKEIGHPAPFPKELPYRLIKMNTYIGDTIYDPFMGSGTTGVVCKELNRNFIGSELDSKYYNIAIERIKNA